jgi:hypothetical protein
MKRKWGPESRFKIRFPADLTDHEPQCSPGGARELRSSQSTARKKEPMGVKLHGCARSCRAPVTKIVGWAEDAASMMWHSYHLIEELGMGR